MNSVSIMVKSALKMMNCTHSPSSSGERSRLKTHNLCSSFPFFNRMFTENARSSTGMQPKNCHFPCKIIIFQSKQHQFSNSYDFRTGGHSGSRTSTTASCEWTESKRNQSKSMEINQNQWKSIEINRTPQQEIKKC